MSKVQNRHTGVRGGCFVIGMKIPNPTADREKDPGDTQNILLAVDSEKDPSRFTLNLSETNYQIASR